MINQTYFQEEIKCRLKAWNLCYYSIQTLFSSRLLPKNLKLRIYKTIMLPVGLYGCEALSLTLREERRLRLFENWILKWIFWPNRNTNGEWRRLHNDELLGLYISPLSLLIRTYLLMTMVSLYTRQGGIATGISQEFVLISY
jgi:hypothetical protein